MSDVKWSIQDNQITGRKKTGGEIALKGFDYQSAYACLQLSYLLDGSKNLAAVRYEGAQDIDLRYEDGKEKYVQIKNEPDKRYTLNELKNILLGFAEDWITTSRNENLSFEVVARNNSIDASVTRLRDGAPINKDLKEITELLEKSNQGSIVSRYVLGLSEDERQEFARNFIERISFAFGMGGTIDELSFFETRTYAELARYGVSSSDLQPAFLKLRDALRPKRVFRRADVQEILKPFIGKAAIDIFNRRVEVLTGELLSLRADNERIQGFYGGAPLGWDIIAANGDIPRDQQDDLVELLREPSVVPRLYCLIAEPGAGKSTLAWRVAAELFRRYNALVLHIKIGEDIEPWYFMEQFYAQVQRPFYVLVDDVFRYSEINSVISSNLNSSLPITILATSRKNEYRPHLSFKTESIALEPPSDNEKERILHRLGKSRASLSPEQQKRLDNANQFLVMMMELETGKKLHQTISSVLARLKKDNEPIYRAYEYLCFSYQFSLSMPESLLEKLDSQGYFYNLPEKAEGLIFRYEGRQNYIRAGHPLIAEVTFGIYNRNFAYVLSEIVNACSPANDMERAYIAMLLRVAAIKEPALVKNALPQIQKVIDECKALAAINELRDWQRMHLALKQSAEAENCIDEALKLKPKSSSDCSILLQFYRLRNREKEALTVVAHWFKNNPNQYVGREEFLNLIESYGNSEDIETAISETDKWLLNHSENTNVRTFYLGLVERKGTPEQVAQVLEETRNWLLDHPANQGVRTFYLSLVERCGTDEQIERVLLETKQWLQEHSNATDVWHRIISLLIRFDRIQEAGELIAQATSLHPQDRNLNSQYLRLFQRSADEQAVRKIFEMLIKNFPQDGKIPSQFAAWLSEQEHVEEARQIYQRFREKNPRNFGIRHGYGRLLLREENYLEAAKEFQAALNIHRGHRMAHDGLAFAMSKLGEKAEASGEHETAKRFYEIAEREFKQAIYWAKKQRDYYPQGILYANLGWFYLARGRYADAKTAFKSSIFENKNNFVNYWGLARSHIGLGNYQAAAEALQTALTKAEEAKIVLQPPASEEIPELLLQCKENLGKSEKTN